MDKGVRIIEVTLYCNWWWLWADDHIPTGMHIHTYSSPPKFGILLSSDATRTNPPLSIAEPSLFGEDGRRTWLKVVNPDPGNSSTTTLPGLVHGVIFFCTSPSESALGKSKEVGTGVACVVGFSSADLAFGDRDFNYSKKQKLLTDKAGGQNLPILSPLLASLVLWPAQHFNLTGGPSIRSHASNFIQHWLKDENEHR